MKLNIFIDGSWLFKVCAGQGVLAIKTENPSNAFPFDFQKLNSYLLDHVKRVNPTASEIGEKYLVTSVFDIPADVDQWPQNQNSDPDELAISTEMIERTKANSDARYYFAQRAIDSGYSEATILKPVLKPWMVRNLARKRYQEKQVDTTVVALLVKSAIVNPNDYHVLVAGDSDMIPALQTAYPEFSKNVFIATTHPDELDSRHRQTSFSYSQFDFKIEPVYLQQNVDKIIEGENIYRCVDCNSVFSRQAPIPSRSQPHCKKCYRSRP